MIDYLLEDNNTKLIIKGDEWPEEILAEYQDDIKIIEVLGSYRELRNLIYCPNLETVVLGPNIKIIGHGVFCELTKLWR